MSTIVIIGSGMGGLMCGNLLARKGHRVTIFESHTSPGGYTAGFWKKGFYFESGTVSFESSQQIFKAMKDIGVYDRLQFTRQYIRWKTEEFDCIPDSIDTLKQTLLHAYSSDKERLMRFFRDVDPTVQAMKRLGAPKSVFGAISYPFNLLKFMTTYKRYENVTLSEFASRYFDKGSRLHQFVEELGYPDMSAALLGPALLVIIEDYWTVQNGMQPWADALAENFKKFGGELKLNSKVDKILTENGKAIGVLCKGQKYAADYVISASDYKKTFLTLLDDTSVCGKEFIEKLKHAPVSESCFVVYCGLKIDREEMQKYMEVAHIIYNDFHPDLDYHNVNDEHLFEKASLLLYSPSLMDARLAPEGKSSLMIVTTVPHAWMNTWGGGDRETYKKLKEKAKKALIQRAAKIIPGLEKHIEFEDAATPLTYERYTHNTEGASSAWSWNPNKRYHKNLYSVQIDTPVRNLLISSCWAGQMGGIPNAVAAAYACTKKIQ